MQQGTMQRKVSMKKQISIISQAELARQLDASRSTIGRLVGKGMPHLADGRLERSEALRWLANYSSGYPGGWTARMRGKDGLGVRAQALLAGDPPAAAPAPEPVVAEDKAEYAMLDRIRERAAVLLPTLARRLGLPEHVAIQAHDVFDLTLALCDADREYFSPDGDGYQWPPFYPPNQKEPSAKVEAAADKFYDQLDKLLDEIRTGAKPKRKTVNRM